MDSLEGASGGLLRDEWKKIEFEFHSLKDRFVNVSGVYREFDLSEIKDRFSESEDTFLELQRSYLSRESKLLKTSGGEMRKRLILTARRKRQ